MAPESPSAVPLPGLEGYLLLPVEFVQRDKPSYENGGYWQFGSFRLDAGRVPVKLLLIFDSLPGPLGLNLPEMEKGSFEMGDLTAKVTWLTISTSVPEVVRFYFKSDMPANLAQVLLLKDESAGLPWPPPEPGTGTWLKEPAKFRTMGPTADQGRWRVKLTIEFDGKELPAEFRVVCDCPRESLEVTISPDSPRATGCLIGPGDMPNSFIVTVRPTSL
ncbi:MAG: hypothetical protein HY508_15630, partial [Acidobacteria bacterium]|nr:hypothetical protein [Acidobacteriota bacterium]